MFYKPRRVVTSHGDPDARKTVYDFLPSLKEWVFPVGRLDKETSGLLLLTNDTGFSEKITNPLSKIPKAYLVKVNFRPSPEQLSLIEQGLTLKNGQKTLPAEVRVLKVKDKSATLEMVIVEGKNRQVRRMIEALDGKVLKLVRTRIGNLSLGDLPIGHYRPLSRDEIDMLESSTKSTKKH
jgi:23S rRNA pseudouridine2605 synthase